jgi:putative tributyrin esterase
MKSRFSLLALVLLPTAALAQPLPVKTVEFDSPAVGRKMKYNIVLPARYDDAKDERFPVLYLLHGYSGNYTNWAGMGVPAYARAYDLIVVMPDGGNGWYVNWAKSEEGQKNYWEDAIAKDVVGHVDANFRTVARREGRAINGLSMGGYGGLVVGLRNPDMFCSVGSHSGAVAWARQAGERIKSGTTPKKLAKELSKEPNKGIDIPGFSSQFERSPNGKMFTTYEEAAAYDPFELVVKLPREKLPHVYLDCGLEDGLYKSNADLAKILLNNKITHTFAQSPGKHDGAYWRRAVRESMAVQYAVIKENLARGPARD